MLFFAEGLLLLGMHITDRTRRTGMSSVGKLMAKAARKLHDHPGGGRAQGEPDRNSHSVLLEPRERERDPLQPCYPILLSLGSCLRGSLCLDNPHPHPTPSSCSVSGTSTLHLISQPGTNFSERPPQATPPKLIKGFMPFSELTDIHEHLFIIVYLLVSVHHSSFAIKGIDPFSLF